MHTTPAARVSPVQSNILYQQAHESGRFRQTTDLDEMGVEIRNALAKVMLVMQL
jgi:hypothetical protein